MWKSAHFRVGASCLTTHPLFIPLQDDLRFFHNPIPALPSAHLTIRFPLRRRSTGLPRFTYMPLDGLGLGTTCSPVESSSAIGEGGNSYTIPLTFWFKSISIFDLSVLTTFIGSSHLFPIPPYSSPQPL